MSDPYCPPPDSSDYLEGGIVYPIPVGKESTSATNPNHNDINYDEPKSDKNQSSLSNVQENATKEKALKLQSRIQNEFYTRSSKSPTVLRAAGGRAGKTVRPIYTTQSNIAKKVVNEI